MMRINSTRTIHSRSLFLLLCILLSNTYSCTFRSNQDIYPCLSVVFDSTTNPNASCFRIPALACAPNGDLIAVVDERISGCGDLRMNPDINIVMRRSTDGGKSWAEKKTLVDYPRGQSASDPSLIIDSDSGEVLLIYNYMDLERGKDRYFFHLIRSRDNGQSWTEPEDITPQLSLPEQADMFRFITSGRGLQTRAGRLIHTMVYPGLGVRLIASDDHGQSWYLLSQLISPADESKLVELDDGTLLLNSRANGVGCRYIHLSGDGGKTWLSRPANDLPDPGCNASMLLIENIPGSNRGGILLFSNVSDTAIRRNLEVKISDDGGESWKQGKAIWPGSAAYSSLCRMENGEIGVLFERNNYSEVAFARFPLSWLQGE